MDQWLQAIREQLSDHGIKYLTAAGFTLAGWLAARWKAARDWRKREFFNRLNVSLNALHDGQLLIRTVLEKSCRKSFSIRSQHSGSFRPLRKRHPITRSSPSATKIAGSI